VNGSPSRRRGKRKRPTPPHPDRWGGPPRRPEASLSLEAPEVRPAGSQRAASGTPRPTHVMATAWGIPSPDDPAGGGPLVRGPPGSRRRVLRAARAVVWRPALGRRRVKFFLWVTDSPAPPWCGPDPAAGLTGCAAGGPNWTGKSGRRAGRAHHRSCLASSSVPLTGRGENHESNVGEILSCPAQLSTSFFRQNSLPVATPDQFARSARPRKTIQRIQI
jgi:hypothetical protein